MSTAAFVSTDTTTAGAWIGVYGSAGYYKMEGGSSTIVSSGVGASAVSVVAASVFSYSSGNTFDGPYLKTLQRAADPTTCDADVWYDGTAVVFRVNPGDSTVRRMSIYLMDWDSGRSTQPYVTAHGNSTHLADATLYADPALLSGLWATFDVSGDVDIYIPNTVGDNANIYGLFFDSVSGDTTPPVVASANVNSGGTTLTILFTETGSAPVLPASSVAGFTLTASGGAVMLSSTAISGTTFTATTSRTIASSETLTLAYAPGNVTDSATGHNPLASFSGTAVTNNSTQTSPLSPGTSTATTVKIGVTALAATGGTPPYTYQWYGSMTPGFTPGSGNLLSGQTGQNLVDYSVTTGNVYYFVRRSTDSAGAPATVDTVQYNVTDVSGVMGGVGVKSGQIYRGR